MRQVRTPVLAVSVEHDQYTPRETMDQLCAKLTATPIHRDHYRETQAGARLDHFTWVRAAGPLAATVATFPSG